MNGFTEAQYLAAIPKCCAYKTLEEHFGMMLCWGLAQSLRDGETMNCAGCDLNMDSPLTTGEKQEPSR